MRRAAYTLAACVLLTLAACTDGPATERVARAQGLRAVEVTGYRVFGCGEQDQLRTGFRAIDPNGERVTGVVCSSISPLGKTHTLRID